jgi:quercetin dioxygenase-like cupin family protein
MKILRSATIAIGVFLTAAGPAGTAVSPDSSTDQPSKVTLQHIEYPGDGYDTSVVRTELPANLIAPVHTHPGIEIMYIVKGGGTLSVRGQPDRRLGPGDSALIAPATPHSIRVGSEPTEIISTYVLTKGLPAMTIVSNLTGSTIEKSRPALPRGPSTSN